MALSEKKKAEIFGAKKVKTGSSTQVEDLLGKIKENIKNKKYRFSEHAHRRSEERSISYRDALYVLLNGFHEKEKTVFNFRRATWKYAIRGKTIDGIEARVIVAFEKGMVIITIIKLIKKRRKSHEK